jgi:hypothetical protein
VTDEAHRLACWIEFIDAAEAAAIGQYEKASELVKRCSSVRTELAAFAKAIQEGRVVKVGPYKYRPANPAEKGMEPLQQTR